jgi:hypothetical protein
MKFEKGKSGNLKGRPKSSYNGSTDAVIELKKLVSRKSKAAFKALWEAVEAKEPWALQIFFQELVCKLEIVHGHEDNPIEEVKAVKAGILEVVKNMLTEEQYSTFKLWIAKTEMSKIN